MDLFNLMATIGLDSTAFDEGLNSVKDKASSLGNFVSGGFKTAGVAIAAVGSAALAAGGAIVKGAGDVASYGDNIDKMSQKMGISAQAYQEWDAVLQHSGTSIEALKPSMKTLAKQAESNSDAFQKLGISEEEVKSLSQEDLFAKVIAGLQDMGEGSERTAVASELLGKGAIELGALMNTSAEDTQAMRDRVHELGGVMSDDAVKAAAAYQDSLQDMTTAFDGLSRNLLSTFMPSITAVMDGLTGIFSGDYSEGADNISKGIDQIIQNLLDGAPKVLEVGAKILENLAESILQNIPKVFPALIKLVMDVADTLVKQLPMLASTAVELIVVISKGIRDSLPTLIPTMVDVVLEIVDTLIDNIDVLVDGTIEFMTGFAEGMIAAMPKIIEKVPVIIEKLVKAIVANAPRLVIAVIKLYAEVIKTMLAYAPQIINYVKEVINNVITAVANFGSNVINSVKTFFVNLITNIGQSLTQIPTIVSQLFTNTITSVKSFFTSMLSTAKNNFLKLVDSTNKGMSDMLHKVVDWLSQLPGKMAYWIGYAIGSFIKVVNELPGKVMSVLTTVLSKFSDFARSFAQNAFDAGRNFINSLISAIKDLPSNIKNIFDDAVRAVSTFAKGIADGAKKAGADFITNLINEVKSLPSEFMEIGKNIVKGLWDGIKGGWDWLKQQVKKLADDLVKGVKDQLKIKSPSRVFMGIGKMVDEGFAKGIIDNEDRVMSAMQDLISIPSMDDFGTQTGGAGISAVNAGSTSGYTQIINITSPTALTPYEVARQTRNATRDMFLSMRV